jgi:hypothetical protein
VDVAELVQAVTKTAATMLPWPYALALVLVVALVLVLGPKLLKLPPLTPAERYTKAPPVTSDGGEAGDEARRDAAPARPDPHPPARDDFGG